MARRRTKWTPKKQREFLELLATNGNVTVTCEALNLRRQTVYEARAVDTDLACNWDDAMQQAADYLEAEARRRAVEGWEEPVYYQGEEAGLVRKFSDTLLIFLMKGANPEKYRDRQQLEHTGPGGGPVQADVRVYIPDNGRGTTDEEP